MGNHDGQEIGEARWRWRSADAAGRLASSYKANRELLEPLARLVVDVLAIVMLLRQRPARSGRRLPVGDSAPGPTKSEH